MNKKGLTWNEIVYAIIAVIVLITLVWVFRKQINEVFRSLMGIIKTTTAGAEETGKNINELIEK
ncbi:hypothetical protein J4443_03500 [Candidatus Woesearchaeota archaeon]|nr:hypothetical protein [Candidatus Woesearchaeota archaeon]